MQTEYALLYLAINIVSLALIGIILHRTNGLSKMMAQRNFAMSIIAEMVFFASDTVFVLINEGMLDFGTTGNNITRLICKEVYFFATSLMCFFWFIYFELIRETAFVREKKNIQCAFSAVCQRVDQLDGSDTVDAEYRFYKKQSEYQQAAPGRSEIEVQLIPETDEEDDHKHLDHIAQKETQKIRTENDQMIVIILVHVHDLQLYVGNKICDGYPGNHSRNNGLALFSADIITTVDRVHGNAHGGKSQQCGGQRTVDVPKEDVVD